MDVGRIGPEEEGEEVLVGGKMVEVGSIEEVDMSTTTTCYKKRRRKRIDNRGFRSKDKVVESSQKREKGRTESSICSYLFLF